MNEIDTAAAERIADGKSAVRNGPSHEARTFELPASIWGMMFASYALFFGGLTIAVGGTFDALGMIIISVCFAIMYFGTAAVLVHVARTHRDLDNDSQSSASGPIETLTGQLSYGAAAAQILTVPVLFGFFGLSSAIIRAIVIPS